jgi:hypothetical protein
MLEERRLDGALLQASEASRNGLGKHNCFGTITIHDSRTDGKGGAKVFD